MNGIAGATLLLIPLVAQNSEAADLVRGVRSKISAGDLASGIAAVEGYRKTTGVDARTGDDRGDPPVRQHRDRKRRR